MRQALIDLRQKMQEKGFDAYLIPTTDYHGSEYVNDYFKCRRYVSGFTGSAGTLIVTADEARLWTDGRYFLQAATQLEGSGIDLMKMGQPGVPTMMEYLESVLTDGQVLAFDGRVMDNTFGRQLEEKFTVAYDTDLVDEIWADRPQIVPSKIYPLDESVTGESAASKLARVREFMTGKGADYHLTTKMEEIAWLYNLRGNDVENNPVFFSFALITPTEDRLYVLDESLHGDGVYPYEQIFTDIQKLDAGTMLLDENVVSYALIKMLPDDVKVISEENPVSLMKALKNPVEIAATKNAHRKDGAAMVNFIYWLKGFAGREEIREITELSASDYLEQCRRQQDGCYDISFESISGYGPNGAIIHYFATPETNKALEPHGFYLVDSGGQYNDGTTDITRTIAVGPLTDEMKKHYTAVLKCHIALSAAKFNAGTTGAELDALTRKPLQALGLDYNHGTGHGVGHILSCHEGPQRIAPAGTKYAILPGMINSDEPGVYLEGKYGIRLENEILCVELASGKLGFEPITFCPFDLEAVEVRDLTEEERQWLNDYHSEVRAKISPLVAPEVAAWLAEATREI